MAQMELPPPPKIHGLFTVVDKLGQGAFGQTFLCRVDGDPQLVVLKKLQMNNPKEVQWAQREATMLKWVTHHRDQLLVEGQPRINLLVDNLPGLDQNPFFEDELAQGIIPKPKMYLALTYAEGPTLAQFLRQAQQTITDDTRVSSSLMVVRLMIELLQIVEQLGLMCVVHHDLKPSNLIMWYHEATRKYHLVVIDMGAACFQYPSQCWGEGSDLEELKTWTEAHRIPPRDYCSTAGNLSAETIAYGLRAQAVQGTEDEEQKLHARYTGNFFDMAGVARILYDMATGRLGEDLPLIRAIQEREAETPLITGIGTLDRLLATLHQPHDVNQLKTDEYWNELSVLFQAFINEVRQNHIVLPIFSEHPPPLIPRYGSSSMSSSSSSGSSSSSSASSTGEHAT